MKLDGGRVREWRERMALSIEDVSTKARVSPHTWVRAEHGEEIRPSSARRVAAALGVEPEQLMGRTSGPLGEAPSPPEISDGERSSRSIVDLPQTEFLREVSASESDEALRELFNRVDAERTNLELMWREDEGNQEARRAYARAVERRMVVFLALYERGIAPRSPAGADLGELAKVMESS